jgi:hypothetical protein
MNIETLPIASIRTDGGTQLRIQTHGDAVEDYARAIEAGGIFPPVVAYYDGAAYWLADGFHRLAAYERLGRTAVDVAVYEGTQRDAVLHAARANTEHGLRATRADRRNAVAVLLADDEWRQWSDRELGRIVGVDGKTVAAVRHQLGHSIDTTRKMMRDGQELRIQTDAIGKGRNASTAEIPQSLPPADPTEADRKTAQRIVDTLGVSLGDALAWAIVQRRKREAAAMERAVREQARRIERDKAERAARRRIAELPKARQDALRKGFDAARDIAEKTGLRLADVLAVVQSTNDGTTKGKR